MLKELLHLLQSNEAVIAGIAGIIGAIIALTSQFIINHITETNKIKLKYTEAFLDLKVKTTIHLLKEFKNFTNNNRFLFFDSLSMVSSNYNLDKVYDNNHILKILKVLDTINKNIETFHNLLNREVYFINYSRIHKINNYLDKGKHLINNNKKLLENISAKTNEDKQKILFQVVDNLFPWITDEYKYTINLHELIPKDYSFQTSTELLISTPIDLLFHDVTNKYLKPMQFFKNMTLLTSTIEKSNQIINKDEKPKFNTYKKDATNLKEFIYTFYKVFGDLFIITLIYYPIHLIGQYTKKIPFTIIFLFILLLISVITLKLYQLI